MRPLTCLLLVATAAPARADCDAAAAPLAELVRAGRWVDAHLMAGTLVALCPGAARADEWRVLDALALDALDEPARARALLAAVPALRARTLLAWSYLRAGDRQAYREIAPGLAPATAARLLALAATGDDAAFSGAAARLDADLRRAALRAHADYRHARRRSPALAGVLSAVLPGAGQAYAGAWEGAAVSLALNAVLIGATVELARHELYWSAGATGVAASVFYVGGILNAADAAGRANDVASEGARLELERLLLPEAAP